MPYSLAVAGASGVFDTLVAAVVEGVPVVLGGVDAEGSEAEQPVSNKVSVSGPAVARIMSQEDKGLAELMAPDARTREN